MFKYIVSLLCLVCGLSSVAMAEVEVVTTPLLSFPPAELVVGHTNSVRAVAYSPDGSRIVSGSRDNTLKIWDASSGKELATFSGHTDSVWEVAYSPDGSRIVSGSWDNMLKIWDANSGQLLSSLEAHTGGVSAIAFSPSGHRIYSASWDHRTIKVWASDLNIVDISVRLPRSTYNTGETLSCNLDITTSANASGAYAVYAALLYPPTLGYFVTIKENKEFSLPNDIQAYRPKIELSGTKTLYPLEMEIRPSMKAGNYQCCGVITATNIKYLRPDRSLCHLFFFKYPKPTFHPHQHQS